MVTSEQKHDLMRATWRPGGAQFRQVEEGQGQRAAFVRLCDEE
jgi:hypothetical protein